MGPKPYQVHSNIRGCQSSTWSAGEETIRGISTKLQREQNIKKQDNNAKKEGKENERAIMKNDG